MVSRSRLRSVLTGLALYTVAAALIGYFGVNAYTGKYGLNARQEIDQEIVALTSELARLKRERDQTRQAPPTTTDTADRRSGPLRGGRPEALMVIRCPFNSRNMTSHSIDSCMKPRENSLAHNRHSSA